MVNQVKVGDKAPEVFREAQKVISLFKTSLIINWWIYLSGL
jgi:hypothetical protein